MPELPEVETTCRGIAPLVTGRRVSGITVRNPHLRYPVSAGLRERLVDQRVVAVERRGKYLWLRCGSGCLIMHLGMSGSLCVVPLSTAPRKHDHVDVCFGAECCLRLHDPRRFSAVLWCDDDPLRHPLLRDIGVEPLSDELDADYLYCRSRGRRVTVKQFLMDSRVVAGIGNIYANEALHLAAISPLRRTGRISRARYGRLGEAIKAVLGDAIEQGGTTLRDFYHGAGNPGYFRQRLRVYQRHGLPCLRCGHVIRVTRVGQRSSFHCACCQT